MKVKVNSITSCPDMENGTEAWIDAVGTQLPLITPDGVDRLQTNWDFAVTEVRKIEKTEDSGLTLITSQ